MAVQFIDFERMNAEIKSEIFQKTDKFLRIDEFANPPPESEYVRCFEKEFADYCGTRFAVGVGSGTSALTLSLIAAGIRNGNEVITVPNTFIATALAIASSGARPVFTEIDPKTHNIDPKRIKDKITDKTKAIVPVHLYGQPCDMKEIMEIAEENDLCVIEDSCQAHGATYGGKKTGSIGDVGCFSFFPTKNLGCFGDGGAITTDNEEINERVKSMKEYKGPDTDSALRMNPCGHSRLDPFQAAILQIKIKYLDKWNEMRRRNANLYGKLIQCSGIETPTEAKDRKHVFYLYVIKAERRDSLKIWLETHGIKTKIHYPFPIHLQKCFGDLNLPAGSFPVAEDVSKRILSLPMFPQLTSEEIVEVGEAVRKWDERQKN